MMTTKVVLLCILLTLLNAELTSINSAPVASLSPTDCWLRFMRTATD